RLERDHAADAEDDGARAARFDRLTKRTGAGVVQVRHLVDLPPATADGVAAVTFRFRERQVPHAEAPDLAANDAAGVSRIDAPEVRLLVVEFQRRGWKGRLLRLATELRRLARRLRDRARIGAEVDVVRPRAGGRAPREDGIFRRVFVVLERRRFHRTLR